MKDITLIYKIIIFLSIILKDKKKNIRNFKTIKNNKNLKKYTVVKMSKIYNNNNNYFKIKIRYKMKIVITKVAVSTKINLLKNKK